MDLGESGGQRGDLQFSDLGGPWWSGETWEVWGDLRESGGILGSLGGTRGASGELRESGGTSGCLRGSRDLGDPCLTERNQ